MIRQPTRQPNRRDFLKQASAWTAVAGGTFLTSGCNQNGQSNLPEQPTDAGSPSTTPENTKKETTVNDELVPIVDTHQHLWDLDILRLPWLKNEGVASIRKSFVTKDYLAATKGLNVVKTVYMEVNAHPEDQVKEAEYVIGLCEDKSNPMAAAVIGGSPQSEGFKDYITPFAENAYIKGVRTVLHDADRKKGMCLEPQFVKNIQLLGDLGLRYDLCMRPDEIIDGVALVDQCPKTRFVVDHCGNMSVQPTDKELRQAWMKGMQEMAKRESTVCKISGIIATADKENWKPSDLAPNINFCIETFGEDRVYFAGDWPVCTLTASYVAWVNALKEIVRDRSDEFKKKLFHDNAVSFYELDSV